MTTSLAHLLTGSGAFARDPLTVIDVGCSGGIIDEVRQFEPALRAVGFDPLQPEINRLQRHETHPDVHYECAFVGTPAADSQVHIASPYEFDLIARSSAGRYAEDHGFDYETHLTGVDQPLLSTTRYALDAWLDDHRDWRVDFIKTDTDGHDLDVLRSLGARLDDVLMAHVEVFFDVLPRPGNAFPTVAEFMHGKGFRLYDLDVVRYGRAALPLPFEWDVPAQTTHGQVVWGTALFARDLVSEDAPRPEQILKLAALFDTFGLADCALELLEAHEAEIAQAGINIQEVSDLLARRAGWDEPLSDVRQRFAADPTAFFRSTVGAVDAQAHRAPTPLPLQRDANPVPLTAGSAGSHALGEGWWPAEPDGTWMSASSAVIETALTDGAQPGDVLILDCWALGSMDAGRALAATCADVPMPLQAAEGTSVRFKIDHAVGPGDATIVIHVWPLDRPGDFGYPDDQRELGLRVSAISLHPHGASA